MAEVPDERTASPSVAFDGRFDSARELIPAQRHRCEEGLREGGRWPISVVLQPDPAAPVSAALQQMTVEAAGFAGVEHWRTGRVGTAHLTVRALEWRREHVPDGDPAVQRYAAALSRAVAGTGRLRFLLQGVVVTPGSVMAIAVPSADRADQLLSRLADELGSDGWMEAAIGLREFWYVNLLHFAGPIADPDGLLGWADARRHLLIGDTTIGDCRLIRWDHHLSEYRPELYPVTLAAFDL